MENKRWWQLIKKYKEHSGKIFEIGSTIGISKAQAVEFAKKGYIKMPDKIEETKTTKTEANKKTEKIINKK
tara:strand:+ start:312 stop:524 length:213 start_codon:yes stop_codon:yes gene_type:complete